MRKIINLVVQHVPVMNFNPLQSHVINLPQLTSQFPSDIYLIQGHVLVFQKGQGNEQQSGSVSNPTSVNARLSCTPDACATSSDGINEGYKLYGINFFLSMLALFLSVYFCMQISFIYLLIFTQLVVELIYCIIYKDVYDAIASTCS